MIFLIAINDTKFLKPWVSAEVKESEFNAHALPQANNSLEREMLCAIDYPHGMIFHIRHVVDKCISLLPSSPPSSRPSHDNLLPSSHCPSIYVFSLPTLHNYFENLVRL